VAKPLLSFILKYIIVGTLALNILDIWQEELELFKFFYFYVNELDTVVVMQAVILGFSLKPSSKLNTILKKKNISSYKYILEYNPENPLNLPIKQTLNSIAGVYLCINLIDEKLYVGSAGINRMYRRYTGHLLNSKGGSILVNRAVKKHGLKNFAFVVIETTPDGKNVTEILKMEQKYIDTLLPEYNIAKIAGSLLNTK
jgi:hypothetical protein